MWWSQLPCWRWFPWEESSPAQTTAPDRRRRSGRPIEVRAKNISEANAASFDDGYEICLAAGLTALAERLDVKPATPRAVARKFSMGYTPALRRGPYLGCLDAFLGH